MEALILASGSSGNAALIRAGGVSVLVDAGVSALQLQLRLAAFGCATDEVDAIFLTHEHSDHIRGLDVFLRRHRAAPVWATRGTWSGLRVRSGGGGDLSTGSTMRVGSLRVTPVSTSHDAAEPVAYVFDDGDHCIAYCTDTGRFTTLLEQRLAGCDLLLLETNHDSDMLRNGPYPWALKQRIRSSTGHLGNHQSGEAVTAVKSSVLKAVVGLHLSAENNCPTLVRQTLREAVCEAIPVEVVTRNEMLKATVDGSGATLERHELPARPPRKGQE